MIETGGRMKDTEIAAMREAAKRWVAEMPATEPLAVVGRGIIDLSDALAAAQDQIKSLKKVVREALGTHGEPCDESKCGFKDACREALTHGET